MTTRYVGAGGNDANDGLSWANRKLTLNGAEDSPVAAGDTVYVGPGAYRETLTVDVSGTSGNPITYIGDYTGANTDGVGGVVRITGSNDDQTATRTRCITASAKAYRTMRGFTMDGVTSSSIAVYLTGAGCTDWIIDECYIAAPVGGTGIYCDGASQARVTVSACYIEGEPSAIGIYFSHGSTLNDVAHVVENTIIHAASAAGGVYSFKVGGVTVKNCAVLDAGVGIRVQSALAVGQTLTVRNCIVARCATGLQATTTAEFSEDYNAVSNCVTARTNVTAGANSVARLQLQDTRWFHETVNGGTLITPYDLASYSTLVELNSGTGAPSTDMRGASQTGSYREWGPLEYNASLDIEAGSGAAVGPVIGCGFIRGVS